MHTARFAPQSSCLTALDGLNMLANAQDET